jgi:hypothetical protein
MTTQEIKDRIQYIKDVSGDSEHAHSKEDKLAHDFIAYVATLDAPIAKKARLVLETYTIDFSRWYA